MTNENKIVIFDVDGTLSDPSHRRHFVRTKPANWFAFNELMVDDGINEQVVEVYKSLQQNGYHMVVFTARGDDYRDETVKWLEDNGILYKDLFMRREGKGEKNESGVKDSVVKQRMLDELINKYPSKEILMAVDDRHQVIQDVWIKNGIFVFDVGQGQIF